jgi:hypothetical protein
MELEIKNGVIESAFLGYEDHGILTIMLQLNYGSSAQGFGGYQLDSYSEELKQRVPSKACGLFVQRILEVVGANSWDELKGKHVRVKGDGWRLKAIGHILKDQWFVPSDELKTLGD